MRYPSQLDLNIGIFVVLSKFIPSQHDNDKVISVADLKRMNIAGTASSYSYSLHNM